jgi:DNA-binding NtrC family response regulator
MNKNSILILDDEYNIVDMIKQMLEREKYSVMGLTEPLNALDHFNVNYASYGLVISDLRMPVMNWFDLPKI